MLGICSASRSCMVILSSFAALADAFTQPHCAARSRTTGPDVPVRLHSIDNLLTSLIGDPRSSVGSSVYDCPSSVNREIVFPDIEKDKLDLCCFKAQDKSASSFTGVSMSHTLVRVYHPAAYSNRKKKPLCSWRLLGLARVFHEFARDPFSWDSWSAPASFHSRDHPLLARGFCGRLTYRSGDLCTGLASTSRVNCLSSGLRTPGPESGLRHQLLHAGASHVPPGVRDPVAPVTPSRPQADFLLSRHRVIGTRMPRKSDMPRYSFSPSTCALLQQRIAANCSPTIPTPRWRSLVVTCALRPG